MNRPNAARQQFVLWGLLFGLWCLLVFAFAGQLVFTAGMAWSQALMMAARDWLPWAALTPIVAWLALRFPLERQRLYLSVPVHITACALALLFYELVARPLLGPQGPGHRMRGEFPPGQRPDNGPPFGGEPGLPEGGVPPDAPDRPFAGRAGQRRLPLANALIIHARFNIPIYWVIVSMVHALAYYRRSEEQAREGAELEARLVDAKLMALRMQLHPHFLFNTLNAISTLVHKDPQAADEMIGNLSELLRATLDTAEQEIPLRQELAFLDRYLEIQQVRFGERLRIEQEIDATALDGLVPALILQPLVENAIRHGIEPQAKPGVVSLRAQRRDDRLKLTVRDNGAGLNKPGQSQEGIGLANTKARLQTLYGSEAQLFLNSAAEGGFAVEIEIPYHDHPHAHR